MTRYHIRLDIRGALRNWNTRKFEGVINDEFGHLMPAKAAKEQLQILLTHGVNFLPVGKCDGFDSAEKGCPGHEGKK